MTVSAFAECDPDATVIEDATYIDGSCVWPWDPGDCAWDCEPSSDQARPTPYQAGSWMTCGPGSSAAMIRITVNNPSRDRAVYWYANDGQVLGVSGGGNGPYCCDGQQAFPDTYRTYGAPMQTCYAPIPFRLPEMESRGECVDSPGSCSAVGTSGVGAVLALFGGLVLLGRRESV